MPSTMAAPWMRMAATNLTRNEDPGLAGKAAQRKRNAAGRVLTKASGGPPRSYPGLADHPDHKIAALQMSGFGGMLAVELSDPGRVNEFLKRRAWPPQP